MKIVEHYDSIISEVPILTVALFWSARQGENSLILVFQAVQELKTKISPFHEGFILEAIKMQFAIASLATFSHNKPIQISLEYQ